MKSRIFALMAWAIFASFGCTTLNGVVSGDTNPINGEPLSYYTPRNGSYSGNSSYSSGFQGSQKSRVQAVAEGAVEDIKLAYREDFSRYYQNSSFDAQYVPSAGGGAKIVVEWTSSAVMFPLGEYDVLNPSVQSYNKREIAGFQEMVGREVQKLAARLRSEGLEAQYRIVAAYWGMADRIPVRRPLVYKGEWGAIKMPSERTTLNGAAREFKIMPGERIGNEELAALRCFSLKQWLHVTVSKYHQDIDDKFVVETVAKSGRDYRVAKIVITIAGK